MPRLLLLTPSELSRDPRARRAAAAARRLGADVVGVSGQISGEAPAPLEGIDIVRVGRPGRVDALRDLGGARRRSSTLLREARGLYRLVRLAGRTLVLARAASRSGPADVVHANDLDTLPAAWIAARRVRARLVYDAHELYGDFEADPPRVYRSAISLLERLLVRRAAAVITVSDGLADELGRRLRLAERPFVVLNAPEVAGGDPEPHEGPLRAVYTGGFGSGRPLDDLLTAFDGVADAELTLFALQQPPEQLRRAVGSRANVADLLPPDRVVDSLGRFDVGVIFDRPVTRNAELSLPNKLFEYLMGGLAVVAPALPSLAPIVEREGVGVLFDPGRPADLRRAIVELAGDRARTLELRRRARRAALARYNAEAQVPVLARAWALE